MQQGYPLWTLASDISELELSGMAPDSALQ